MIGGVLMGLLFGKIGYYLVLGWCCISIFVFMVSWGSREDVAKGTSLLGIVGVPLEVSKQRVSDGEFRPEPHG